MNFRSFPFRLILNHIRFKSTSAARTSHYDALGVSPKSTQNEIKSAYYKLSMVYHPDKNDDEASLQKFRAITEAYEVLGNVNTRKMYDKGLYFRSAVVSDDVTDRFHKSRETRSRPPPPDGRTPIYDFDEWAKNHYGATFRRQMENKRRSDHYRDTREQTIQTQKLEKVVFSLLALVLLCMYYTSAESFDQSEFGGVLYKRPSKD
ncbi:unnamed protein product [Diabrotica balteata]|uniref:J domain-containing protein n=1 Tax=Diabrotica balteata TaxID=107213 RepID=A0A9N9SYR8_DIABA|nr:unnamed protein product [Diabrotica balteata]